MRTRRYYVKQDLELLERAAAHHHGVAALECLSEASIALEAPGRLWGTAGVVIVQPSCYTVILRWMRVRRKPCRRAASLVAVLCCKLEAQQLLFRGVVLYTH